MGTAKYLNHIIALDLDDTLLNSRGEVSERSLEVLKRCKDSGFHIVVSSTRGYSTCSKIAELISADYICCQAGNMIIDKDMNIIYKNPFNADDVSALIEHFSKYTQNFVIDSDFALCGIANDDFVKRWGLTRCDMETLKTLNAYKLCVGFEPSFKDEIVAYCKEKGFVCRKMIDDDYMFITPANSDKYYALEQLMAILNSSPDKLIVFGDDHSDMLSIKNAGFGVAMQNSKDEVLNVSKFVTSTNDEDGVAKFLEENFTI